MQVRAMKSRRGLAGAEGVRATMTTKAWGNEEGSRDRRALQARLHLDSGGVLAAYRFI